MKLCKISKIPLVNFVIFGTEDQSFGTLMDMRQNKAIKYFMDIKEVTSVEKIR